MIVTWLGHASLFLNAAGKTLLIDPWFTEPVFAGARYRYPPSPYSVANAMPRPDFLLLSSARADHAGEATLAQLKRDTVTLASPLPSLKRRLGQFSKVTWAEAWTTVELSAGLRVTFVPNRAASEIVVEADGVRLFHGSDEAPSVDAYREVVKRVGPIDMAFLPYERLQGLFDGIVGLRPKEAAPYASGWAFLEPSLIGKNFAARPTQHEALAAAMKLAHEHGAHLAHLEPGDEWSPETGAINKGLSAGWPQDLEAVRRYAKQLGVSDRPASVVTKDALDAALRALAATTKGAQLGLVVDGVASWSVRGGEVRDGLRGDEGAVISLRGDDLLAIATGETSWEDAWLGGRLHVNGSIPELLIG